ncbi:MAG: two-component sensor histidine kinase [Pseudonocardiales bacterium]|nr:MAG: two-component sensor histidine kinase [Pseudonocardiales bacterium]
MDVTFPGERARWADGASVLACLVLTALAVKGHWSPLPRPAIAAAGTVGGWAGFAAWSWIDGGRLSVDDAVAEAAGVAFVMILGAYTATRRALLASWQDRAEQAESGRRLNEEQARSAERTRIAREMHDVVAHKVSLIALHAGALELTGGASSDRVTQEAALIRVTAREALQELRSVLGVLQSSPGQRATDQAAVERGEPFADLTSLVQASVRAGQPVELHDDAGSLPPGTARVVYRIAQEGLTNARKPAPHASTTVAVHLAEEGTVTVTVHNEPTASAPMDLPGSGSGLVGLAERLRLVDGSIHSGFTADGGWQLRAVVPPPEPRTAASPTAGARIEQPGAAR